MKYLAVAIVGIVLGAAAAAALLYYNPLTAEVTPPSAGDETVLQYRLPDDALTFEIGERLKLSGLKSADDAFWEETIGRSALLGVTLHDASGSPVAVASRLLAASADTDLLLKGVLLSDYWLLTIPGQGSVFLRADDNLWPFLTRTLVPVLYLGRSWHGPVEYQPTMGPGADGSAVILAGTGRFADLKGTAFERYRLTAFASSVDRMAASAELRLPHGLDPVVAKGD
jgi:hypothetical protein